MRPRSVLLRGVAMACALAMVPAVLAAPPKGKRRAKPAVPAPVPAPAATPSAPAIAIPLEAAAAPPGATASTAPHASPAPTAPPHATSTSTATPPAPSHATATPTASSHATPTPTATTTSTAAAPSLPAEPKLTVGATLILYGYFPFLAGAKNNLEVYYANLLLDGAFGHFGFHIEPRIRDTKLRTFFPGAAWIEEGYAFADYGVVAVKVGKLYSRLGLFWDSSFYGNIQSFDGLKLDPDYGLSLEGKLGDAWGAAWWAQFFLVDGRTNISGEGGRDTIAIPGAFRRNQAIARFEPFARLGGASTLKLGVSAEFLQADLPDGTHDVVRAAGDATLSVGKWNLYGEVLRQVGQTVTDFPYAGTPATATIPAVPGRWSSHNNYFLAGTEYTFAGFTLHYTFSYVNYADVSVIEFIHLPGMAYAINANLSVLVDYALWKRIAPEGTSEVDDSLNLAVAAHL
jgi:hypothetical protein